MRKGDNREQTLHDGNLLSHSSVLIQEAEKTGEQDRKERTKKREKKGFCPGYVLCLKENKKKQRRKRKMEKTKECIQCGKSDVEVIRICEGVQLCPTCLADVQIESLEQDLYTSLGEVMPSW